MKYVIAYRGFNSFTDGFDIKYTGNAVITYRYNKEDGTVGTIAINKSGIYHLPASVRAQKNFGFYCNPQTVTEEATIEQLPTSILKDFSGNGLDAYMYGFQGKLNSGVGIYAVDFTTYSKTSVVTDVSHNTVKVVPAVSNYLFIRYAFRPFIDKAADKSIGKVDKFLKMIQEEDGTVDIEPLLGKMTDNLIVAATKEYPDLFGGVTIGNGKIKIGIPGIDKDIVLEAADIDHFKSCLK